MRIGGIEAGGTKMVCAIGEVQTDKGQPGENQVTITERVTIPTEKPKITLPRMAAFLREKESRHSESGVSDRWICTVRPRPMDILPARRSWNGRMSIWWELLHGRSASRSDLIRT